MFELADPWALLLLPLPLIVYWRAPPLYRMGAALIVPEGVGRGVLHRVQPSFGAVGGVFVGPALVWLCLLLALSGPRVLLPTAALPMSGRDLVLALDLSGSMVRDDFWIDGEKATRLEAVKAAGAAFVRRRGGDRVALVVFGSEAYVAAPPSFDTEAVAQNIEQMVIGISGRATNISDAIGLALKRLSDSDAESRVIVLLSDGANNAGAASPRDVAGLARDMGVTIHTIALGPKSLAEAPEGRAVVDVATLQSVADLSGGQMFRVRNTDELEAVTAAIDTLEPTDSAGLAAETYRELWPYPAALAALLCLWIAWRDPAV